MLERQLVRDHTNLVEKDLEKRGQEEKKNEVALFLKKDAKWRELKKESDTLRNERNTLTSKVKELKAQGQDVSSLIGRAKKIPEKIRKLEEDMAALQAETEKTLMGLPNILHDSVPVGASDEDNVVVREWGARDEFGFDLKHHGQLASELGLADFERAVKISGSGFYFLKGDLALFEMALQRYAIDLLIEDGFTLVEPPFMMRRKPYEGVIDISEFEDVIYKVQEDDLYLIATSEHPIGAMHMGEIIEELPLKYAGVSTCFRREIGKHGLDERGLFRVHQFNKVEQFIFCRPEDSWDLHEQLIENAEKLMQGLGIPYQVVNVCTGDIGTVAAKKYDLEGWSPREGKYIELMSCSNCTSYQAARLRIRYRGEDGNRLVHTLNSTMVATSRALRLILENFQEEDGKVRIPKVLREYMGGRESLG